MKDPYLVEPGNHYENDACLEQVEDNNTIGQFDPVGEISDEKEDELNQVEFISLQSLMLDAASSKVEERSMRKCKEHKKGTKTYSSREVLSWKSWPTEEKK
ncbi:22785_t:CDS:1, partial [Cetraspora pellucida]